MQVATLALLKRKVRKTIQDMLLNRTDAGSNVELSRSTKIDPLELPLILIYPDSERVAVLDIPKRYTRNFVCKIEIIGRGDDDDALDLLLERIGEQVEQLMEMGETDEKALGPLVNNLNLVGTRYVFEGDGDTPIGSLILDYEINLITDAIPQGVELDAFKEAGIQWELKDLFTYPPETPLEAEDEIELPQT